MGPSRHGLAPGPTPRTRRPIGADGLGLTAVDRAVAAGAHSGPRGARKSTLGPKQRGKHSKLGGGAVA